MGRVGRKEFWIVIISSICFWIIVTQAAVYLENHLNFFIFSIVLFATWLITISAILCITIKRFHDKDKPWYYGIIGLMIPIFGIIWWVIQCGFMQGDKTVNSYGLPHT